MERERAFDYALEQISQLISSIAPGEQVPSAVALAATTGVSRPIVLQALRHFHDNGRIEIGKGRAGTKAARISPQATRRRLQWLKTERERVLSAARLRETLEVGICTVLAQQGLPAAAAKRAGSLIHEMETLEEPAYGRYLALDAQFHALLAEAIQSSLLRAVYASVRTTITPAFDVLAWPPGRRQQSTAQHRAMLEAIQKKDVIAASSIAWEHSHLATELLERKKFRGGR